MSLEARKRLFSNNFWICRVVLYHRKSKPDWPNRKMVACKAQQPSGGPIENERNQDGLMITEIRWFTMRVTILWRRRKFKPERNCGGLSWMMWHVPEYDESLSFQRKLLTWRLTLECNYLQGDSCLRLLIFHTGSLAAWRYSMASLSPPWL